MPLPGVIEILPLPGPVRAALTVPGSKSITNRALVLAALAQNKVALQGALWSEDTQVMIDSLRLLGFHIQLAPDSNDICNRTITVEGTGGGIPRGGSQSAPLDLYVGNAGTAARFLAALVCLGHGAFRLHGTPRMHERPQAELFLALRQLGYRVDASNDHLPAIIHGTGPRNGQCTVGIKQSSQFASALLLSAETGGWDVRVVGDDSEESSYVQMTRELCHGFPRAGGVFQIEPDASSGSYFWAAAALCPDKPQASITVPNIVQYPQPVASSGITVKNWPNSGWQIDSRFPRFLPLPAEISRVRDLGDSIMTAMVLAPLSPNPVRFTDLGRLRVQECERVRAMRTELVRCGAGVLEDGDTLVIRPSSLAGATIDTYNDHRMAMAFAVLGLRVSGMRIANPACVKKTFPNFFQKLVTPPPHGLGCVIRDPVTNRVLTESELMAE
jgi:3-phosphoshikimate 1-carboxyvinyltransferase